jgi:hypothetical protein
MSTWGRYFALCTPLPFRVLVPIMVPLFTVFDSLAPVSASMSAGCVAWCGADAIPLTSQVLTALYLDAVDEALLEPAAVAARAGLSVSVSLGTTPGIVLWFSGYSDMPRFSDWVTLVLTIVARAAVPPARFDSWKELQLQVLSRIMGCRVLSCPVVSCRVLSCPVVSCRVLSCPVVSCRALPSCARA